MEEKTANTDFWLLGDNFMRAYYQVYDISNKQIGLASSKFISNGSFSLNNSIVYKPPTDSSMGQASTSSNEKIWGMD